MGAQEKVIGLDTNIIVRLIVDDDAEQVSRARSLILERGGFVQSSVLVETAWVLRKTYGYTVVQVAQFLMALYETDTLHFDMGERMPLVLDAMVNGLDIADAVHVASCPVPTFATFDTALARRAAKIFSTPEVITP